VYLNCIVDKTKTEFYKIMEESDRIMDQNIDIGFKRKKKLFIDMDGVIADFNGAVRNLPKDVYDQYAYRHDEIPGIFSTLEPIEGSKEAIALLKNYFELFILSTPSWGGSTSLTEKIEWLKDHYGRDSSNPFYKKVFLTHRKDLVDGDYLIDDRTVNGAIDFMGEFIHFGSSGFENWDRVVEYLLKKENIIL